MDMTEEIKIGSANATTAPITAEVKLTENVSYIDLRSQNFKRRGEKNPSKWKKINSVKYIRQLIITACLDKSYSSLWLQATDILTKGHLIHLN